MSLKTQKTVSASDAPSAAHSKGFLKSCLRRASCVMAVTLGFLICIIGADYLLTQHLYEMRREKEIKATSESLQKKAEGLRERFIQETNRIRGLPAVIGDEKQVVDALANFKAASDQGSLKTGEVATWKDCPELAALNRRLDVVAKEIGYDAIWVIDGAGNGIAASIAREGESYIGVNYADHAFFKQAIAGERGFQYAVGQQADKPNLYFSAPVRDGQRIIGVVAIKLPASRLQRFVENEEVFITEENGIIIVAHDPDMVMRSTDPRRLASFTKEALLALYKKADFMPLNIRPAGQPKYPELMQVDDQPGYYLFSTCTYCDCGLSLQAYTRISRLDEIKAETFLISLIVIVGGAAILLLIMGIVAHIHRIRADNRELQATEVKLLGLNRELDAQRQIAEQANRAKSEFLANMSHEIRTPLNGVLATAELLADMALNERQKKYVDIIRSSGELLLVIINDILDLSKIEAGKIDFQPACMDFRHEAGITASLFAAQAKAKSLRFRIEVAEDVPERIVADPYRLRQVVANLVSNAIKYTDRGSVDAFFTMTGSRDNPRIRFAVTDTGPGVPAEAQKLVFEKFTQINRKEAINGTGLGLPICHALIEMMDGKIGVISDGINGSTFWFEIPFIASPSGDARDDAQPTAVGLRQADHTGCRVLIVEDIEINRFVISEMLTGFNCTVEMANNGKSAIEMMAQNTYDVVFMDCSMPVMNGYDATKEIRKRGDMKTPIVALTAHTYPEEVKKCLSSGMTDFIPKPVKLEYLASALEKWGARLRDAPSCSCAPPKPDDMPAVEAFDPLILNGWYAAMPDKAGKFVELTLKDSARLYGEIVQAIATKNVAELVEGAHALKSVAKQMGGSDLAGLCLELEKIGKEGRPDEALSRVDDFKKAYQAYRGAVESIRMKNGENPGNKS
jgi:signal transduction histidine kinase/DNA-binding response OmpR family regulator